MAAVSAVAHSRGETMCGGILPPHEHAPKPSSSSSVYSHYSKTQPEFHDHPPGTPLLFTFYPLSFKFHSHPPYRTY
jgi:hypothetical protein